MIHAIIFDCYGVLTSDSWEPFYAKYFGNDQQKESEARYTLGQMNIATITYDEFLSKVAELAGIPVQEASDFIENNKMNIRLFELVRQLKKDYKIGMLSNAGDYWLDELFPKENIELFDAIALSFEIQAAKPDEKAYQKICQMLDVRPEETIFVDDIERYVSAARDYGMKAIWYKDYNQFKAELDDILGTDTDS